MHGWIYFVPTHTSTHTQNSKNSIIVVLVNRKHTFAHGFKSISLSRTQHVGVVIVVVVVENHHGHTPVKSSFVL